MERVVDMQTPLVVGKTYLVDTIWVERVGYILPVLSRHFGDISGQLHCHFDQRFISEEFLKKLGMPMYGIAALGCSDVPLQELPLVCYRNYGPDFDESDLDKWRELYDKMDGEKLDLECKNCPHQGLNLKQVEPVMINGRMSLVCPNHYLAFDCEDGSMIERKPKETHDALHSGPSD